MKPLIVYDAETDTLGINFTDEPGTSAEDVADGIVLSYNDNNKPTGIEVDQALARLLGGMRGNSVETFERLAEIARAVGSLPVEGALLHVQASDREGAVEEAVRLGLPDKDRNQLLQAISRVSENTSRLYQEALKEYLKSDPTEAIKRVTLRMPTPLYSMVAALATERKESMHQYMLDGTALAALLMVHMVTHNGEETAPTIKGPKKVR